MSAFVAGSHVGTGQDSWPGVGDDGFFGIRFESIGGLGAHLAGQILAEACVLRLGLNGAHFSSYGSEKKGSPVKSFVRICPADMEVRTSSPIESPQVVAVFHEALVRSFDVAAGLGATGTLIMNTRKSPELGIDYHYCKGCLKCVDACPTGSLTEFREEDGWAEEHRVPLFAWLEPAKGAV